MDLDASALVEPVSQPHTEAATPILIDKPKKSKPQPKAQPVAQDLFSSNTPDNWGATTDWDTPTSDSWGSTADSWGSEPVPVVACAESNLSSLDDLLKMRDLSLQSKKPTSKQKKSKKPKQPMHVIPERYAEWIEVAFEEVSDSANVEQVPVDQGFSDQESSEWQDEGYEKIKLYDEYFGKFIKSVQNNPEQVLRYHFDGNPLWIRKPDEPISACENCGAPRTFEYQIMSHGLNWIIEHSASGPRAKNNLVECGSIYVFSCTRSCLPKSGSDWVPELVFTQKSL